MSFLICLKSEYLKNKRTFSFWLVLFGGLLVPVILFFIQLNRSEFFMKRATDPWNPLVFDAIRSAMPLLFPLFLILIIALNFNLEHKENTWKKLHVIPHKRDSIYFAKLVFIIIQVVLSLLVFSFSLFLFGLLLGIIHPELNFLNTSLDWTTLFKSLAKVFIAYLALIGFQFVLSFYFKNFIVPVAVGLFGLIFGIMLSNWEYSAYNFWSNNFNVIEHLLKKVVGDYTLGIPTYLIFSGMYFLIFIVIGRFLFNRRAL